MAPSTEIDLSGFGLEHVAHIGRGQYASAQHVRETASGADYVAKCISLACLNEHDQDLARQEVFLLQTLNHPYVVGYRDSFLIEGANTLVIVMEYCDAGDLRKAIKVKQKAAEHFSEEQIMIWFVQLCLALQHIHSEKVLHRDLKTSNIFLTDGGATIKLGDFGISRVLEGTTEAAVTIVGTPYYMSPEVCRSEPYNWKSDVWAVGCVLYELCMLKHAFESSSLLGLVYKIVSDHYEPIPSMYSPQLNELIHRLLAKSAEQRPSINEVFAMPYVKGFVARQGVPTSGPALPPMEPPQGLPKRASLRPVQPKPLPPAVATPQPQAPGPGELSPQTRLQVIASRIRRRLVGQKLNFISAFAMFDTDGDGMLTPEAMANALTTMHLGLSESEITELANGLAAHGGGRVSLDAFGAYVKDVPAEVQQHETWARQTFASTGRRLRDTLRAKDVEQRGTLAADVFQAAMNEVAPKVTALQLGILLLLADKNGLGDVDYEQFIAAFAPPVAPTQGATPPGMPPLPGMGPARPPGMPPLPGMGPMPKSPCGSPMSAPGPGPMSPGPDLNNSLSVVDLNLDRTFFTCTASQLGGACGTASAQSRVSSTLSPQGGALVFARIRRRLEAVGLPFSETMYLFNAPGEQELSAEQWLDVASSLPLGVSRAEMQQVFSRVDPESHGRVQISALESMLARSGNADCSRAPAWISNAMQRGLCGRIRQELQALGGVDGNSGLAQESQFRRVVMMTERYLTADQLTSLVLLADKSSDGHIDYVEFTDRFGRAAGFGGAAGSRPPLNVPGGKLPSFPPLAPFEPVSEEEVGVIGARTAWVLERQHFAAERVPGLLALWSSDAMENLEPALAAALLAALPFGLARREAEALLAAAGSIGQLGQLLVHCRTEGIWKARCAWAATNIPGPALRSVLQREVADVESRSLDPTEFAQALVAAGVAVPLVPAVLWLAEKGSQGDVRLGEFLHQFGGVQSPEAVAKKKKGLWSRFMGR